VFPAHRRTIFKIGGTSLLLAALLALCVLLALALGPTRQDLGALISALIEGPSAPGLPAAILWEIRFPRAVAACLAGAALSLGGLVFQALLRNPLAEPYILGVSGGSAVGAILGFMAGLSRFPGVSALAFAGGMTTLAVVLFLRPGSNPLRGDSLLLAGVMVNAFCSALIMFLVAVAEDARLHSILFWLMGDLSGTTPEHLPLLAGTLLPCFAVLLAMARPLNLLLLGEETAMTMGVNVRAAATLLLITTSLMVSATVCSIGLVGFVGLVVPHILRSLLGPDHRTLVPACILGGAAFLVLCDLLARSVPDLGEIPAGVVTALIGAPLFILLLQRAGR